MCRRDEHDRAGFLLKLCQPKIFLDWIHKPNNTSLITRGVKREAIATALHYSVVNRIITLIMRIGIKEDVVFAGGCTRNAFLTRILQERLQMQIQVNEYSKMLSAIGAALYAADQ